MAVGFLEPLLDDGVSAAELDAEDAAFRALAEEVVVAAQCADDVHLLLRLGIRGGVVLIHEPSLPHLECVLV